MIKDYYNQLKKYICDYEKSICVFILLCIDALEFQVGMTKLIQILRGKQSRFITDFELNKNPMFSMLKSFSKNELTNIINLLLASEYLRYKEVRDFQNVLTITSKGYALLEDNTELELSIIDLLSDNDFIELSKDDLELYELLRNKRNTIAKELDVPAYFICYDKSLRLIALNKPTNNDELIEIYGIGTHFIENYASDFLGEIKSFSNSYNKVDPNIIIKKYKELLDIGAITQEEFDTKKKELLGL